MVTYFVVQSFSMGKKGVLIADTPMPAQSAGQAERMAARLALSKPSVIAFSRTGDPSTGDFDDAVVLFTHGELPAELEQAA